MSKPKSNINLSLNKEYKSWLKNLKQKVLATQLKAAVQVNSTLLNFYWELGEDIVRRQVEANWGDGFLKQLNKDLSSEFPDIKGFSLSNIKYIRQWHLFYRDEVEKSQQLVGQLTSIPWGHNLKIISKCQTTAEALYYVGKTIERGWSRNVLAEYALSDIQKPIGVSEYQLTHSLPENLQSQLPSIEEIEQGLRGEL
ncbi:DUF1016 N-terminal domain-containing protein [Endozoicomonas sp. ALC020]|uniref:DUF1016 N-terminal domain-containing protein n=1 Tax=unclassified Endozoicomonas TaxID=2644528 RepID=UPI003BB16845